MDSDVPVPEKKRVSKKLLIYLLLSLSIILLGTTGYFYYQYQKLFKSPVGTQVAAQEEAKKLAGVIGKLMLLPKNETPTVATITDIGKLKDQAFFKDAANGNKVLIYTNSKLAIIYDPRTNLIVNVGPINFSQQENQTTEPSPSISPSPSPTN